MTLNLTKPIRVKNTHAIPSWRGRRFYPVMMEGVVKFENAGIIEEEWQVINLDDLENIPEPVKRRHVCVPLVGDGIIGSPSKWYKKGILIVITEETRDGYYCKVL